MPRTAAPLKPTTLKKYIKDRTKKRVDEDGVESTAKTYNTFIKRTVDRAHALSDMEERSTILERDLEQGIEETIGEPGGKDEPPKQTPDALFQTLERYDIDELSALARQLESSFQD